MVVAIAMAGRVLAARVRCAMPSKKGGKVGSGGSTLHHPRNRNATCSDHHAESKISLDYVRDYLASATSAWHALLQSGARRDIGGTTAVVSPSV